MVGPSAFRKVDEKVKDNVHPKLFVDQGYGLNPKCVDGMASVLNDLSTTL
jgi:hypothetical protein